MRRDADSLRPVGFQRVEEIDAQGPPASLGPLAVERAARWREFLHNTDDASLRAVPEPGVFSPIQYAAHVRDILRVYTDRIVLGLEQDAPTVPIFQPPQEVWEEYNRADVSEMPSQPNVPTGPVIINAAPVPQSPPGMHVSK